MIRKRCKKKARRYLQRDLGGKWTKGEAVCHQDRNHRRNHSLSRLHWWHTRPECLRWYLTAFLKNEAPSSKPHPWSNSAEEVLQHSHSPSCEHDQGVIWDDRLHFSTIRSCRFILHNINFWPQHLLNQSQLMYRLHFCNSFHARAISPNRIHIAAAWLVPNLPTSSVLQC